MIITCIGDCGVDNYHDFHVIRPGGITLNFAVNAKKVFPKNHRIEVICPLGTDKEADIVKNTLYKYGITATIHTLPGKTPMQHIDHDQSGEKIFTKYEEGVLAKYTVGEEGEKIIKNSDFVMTVLFSQMEQFFESVITQHPKGLMGVDFMHLADYEGKPDIVGISRKL
jgi:fructoselysine 6-kinase